VSFVAGLGLVAGCHVPARDERQAVRPKTEEGSPEAFAPGPWLRIGADDTVTVMVNHSEMGQGITTALAMIVAEELDADWARIAVEIAPAKPEYVNPEFGVQATGGSTSVRSSWDVLRNAGATARESLVTAAASIWGVPPGQCRAIEGRVVHEPTGRALRFGQLVSRAGDMSRPSNIKLKKPGRFSVIGRSLPRLDTRTKIDGTAVFGIDVRLPGLLTATVVHPPVFGGRLKSLDASKAKAMPGVRHVTPIESGVAVVADGFWHAKKAADALDITWDLDPADHLSTEKIMARWAELAGRAGRRVRDDGDVDRAMADAARVVEAVYELPFQAHGCPEPMNCTAHVRDGECDIWVPTQNQGGSHEVAAEITGLDPDAVRVHTTFLGGGFGRRGNVDYVAEAVEISKKIQAPVKMIWTREEDIRNDRYRPASYHILRAPLDKAGMPVALSHVFVGPSFMDTMIETFAPCIMPSWLPRPVKNAAARAAIPMVKYFRSSESAAGGAATIAYAIDHLRVEHVRDDPGIPVGAWRSVSNSRNAFVVESFIDEIAAASGRDPLRLRRDLLRRAPKRRNVLKLAASKAGWDKEPPEGIYRGIAVHDFHDTPVAMVAEVSVDKKAGIRIRRVVCAVDCGTVINPKIVKAQIVGAIAFGLTATLKSSITIKDGRVEQSNFDDFPLLRMDEMPKVDVHIVPSDQPPTGIGEVGVPPVAPAVANAVFAATGKRFRRIPIDTTDPAYTSSRK